MAQTQDDCFYVSNDYITQDYKCCNDNYLAVLLRKRKYFVLPSLRDVEQAVSVR